ncbi:MAG: hypothetical protein MI739_14470 [Bacteroidales bacterium]|nr:hypothetical protein [Bacteroidales bacterium]
MNKGLAKFLSVILHPVFMPVLGLFILFNSGSVLEILPFQAKKIILIIVAVGTIVLPLTFVPFFVFQKIIKNIHMDDNRERLIPFFISFVLYTFSFYLLNKLGAPWAVSKFMLIGSIAILALLILSFKWKVSAHMTGIGGIVGSLISFSFLLRVNLDYYIMAFILLSGFLAYSRLTLKKHQPYQVYTGWFLGLCSSFFVLFIF